VVLNAHTESVDEDGEQYPLLEVLVLDHSLDDSTDTPETRAATGRDPPPWYPATVTPVVPLRDSSLQYHGPVPTTGLFAATHLMFWTVAPPVKAFLVIPQSFHTWKEPKCLNPLPES
jgi:hypothetical protein